MITVVWLLKIVLHLCLECSVCLPKAPPRGLVFPSTGNNGSAPAISLIILQFIIGWHLGKPGSVAAGSNTRCD